MAVDETAEALEPREGRRNRAEDALLQAQQEIQRRNRELEALATITEIATRSLEPEHLMKNILPEIVRATGTDMAMIFLDEGKEQGLALKGVYGSAQITEQDEPRLEIGQCLCGLAAARKLNIFSDDILTDPRCTLDICKRAGLHSVAAIPLHSGGKQIGVLAMGSATRRSFAREEHFLSAIADSLATALENASLYEQIKKHAATLEQGVAARTTELSERVREVEQLNLSLAGLLQDLQAANRLSAETARKLEEANTELNTFVYSVSHDLRAPLRGMQGLGQALLEDYGDKLDEVGQKYARLIVSAAEQMDTLIQDLLTYSRLTRAEIEIKPVSLEQVVEDAMRQLQTQIRENDAEVIVSKPLPKVPGHYVILVQVVANLVSNALKFVAPQLKPRIRIWGEIIADVGLPIADVEEQQAPPEVRLSPSVRLWVEDNGIGIAPEHRERIFRIFERLHGMESYTGTGIGLAIVRKGMERIGGRAGVESEVGKGSRFWIELGAVKEQA